MELLDELSQSRGSENGDEVAIWVDGKLYCRDRHGFELFCFFEDVLDALDALEALEALEVLVDSDARDALDDSDALDALDDWDDLDALDDPDDTGGETGLDDSDEDSDEEVISDEEASEIDAEDPNDSPIFNPTSHSLFFLLDLRWICLIERCSGSL